MLNIFKILLVVIFLSIITTHDQPVWAVSMADPSGTLVNPQIPKEDTRVKKLKTFLNVVNSPLEGYAANFVEIADKYEVDWRLVPAIAGVESTFGQAIPYSSYNAYGWNNGAYYFTSWSESIEIVTKTLRENYVNRGAKTVEQIAPIYAPPSKTWAGKVRHFMTKIESTPLPLELTL